jgi:rhodanese-related sulfurtransferase
MLRAIYNCNHLANQPVRLCEPEVVSQYDVRPIYQAAKESHKEALATLTIPNEKFYANEEYGGGFTSASGLRTGVVSGITPQKLDGIATVGTQELVRGLLSAKPPVVIDVAGAFETISGSVALLYAGSALDNATQDEALEKRIAALLLLIAPDTAAPVIFFCAGRNCWMSVNAALRAKKIGYANVQWYRGGIESWKAAGLPTATGVIRAVAQ